MALTTTLATYTLIILLTDGSKLSFGGLYADECNFAALNAAVTFAEYGPKGAVIERVGCYQETR